MITVKTMPAKEKLDHVLEMSDMHQTFLPDLIAKHLGGEAVQELRKHWIVGVRPIPRSTPVEDRYEIAYANWIWIAQTNFNFIRDKLGDEGLRMYEHALVEALKRQNNILAVWLLRLIRSVAPERSFKLTAEKIAYLMQWKTPTSMVDLSKDHFIAQTIHCKILSYPGSEDICRIGCMQANPQMLREQFKVQMSFKRKDHSCTCLVTPLK